MKSNRDLNVQEDLTDDEGDDEFVAKLLAQAKKNEARGLVKPQSTNNSMHNSGEVDAQHAILPEGVIEAHASGRRSRRIAKMLTTSFKPVADELAAEGMVGQSSKPKNDRNVSSGAQSVGKKPRVGKKSFENIEFGDDTASLADGLTEDFFGGKRGSGIVDLDDRVAAVSSADTNGIVDLDAMDDGQKKKKRRSSKKQVKSAFAEEDEWLGEQDANDSNIARPARKKIQYGGGFCDID